MEDIVDYAMPLMIIERLTKDIHNLCLDKKFDEARDLAVHLTAESRVLQHTLTLMREQA